MFQGLVILKCIWYCIGETFSYYLAAKQTAVSCSELYLDAAVPENELHH